MPSKIPTPMTPPRTRVVQGSFTSNLWRQRNQFAVFQPLHSVQITVRCTICYGSVDFLHDSPTFIAFEQTAVLQPLHRTNIASLRTILYAVKYFCNSSLLFVRDDLLEPCALIHVPP